MQLLRSSTSRPLADLPVGPPIAPRPHTLEQLGTIALVRFDHRALPGPTPRPEPKRFDAVAFPTWDGPTRERFYDVGWDNFWAERPTGAARLTKLAATSYDDAVRAVHTLVMSSKPWAAAGDKQAHAVLQAADGAWYTAGLGGIVDAGYGSGAWLAKTSPLDKYRRPVITALAGEVKAVVGGVTTIDLR